MAKILIIDDSWLTRRGLTNMITSLAHEVVEAEYGKEGLVLIDTENPSCVFRDLLMPEMDGYQVLETLKQNGSNTWGFVQTIP